MPDADYLRKRPHQQRAIRRIELLLDTAEKVFEEVGYDAATTNLVAQRAGIPVATLYRWFPDKAAMAEGLASRYLDRLAAAWTGLLSEQDAPPTSVIRSVVRQFAAVAEQSPAMPALLLAGLAPEHEGQAGSRLRSTATQAVEVAFALRIPDLAEADRHRMADAVVTVIFSVLANAAQLEPDERADMVDELGHLLIAWLSARFPPEDEADWREELPLVPPLARTRRAPAPEG